MTGVLDRRTFLKSSLAMCAAPLPARAVAGQSPAARPPAEWRNRQSGMKYRRLGRTGFMVSEIVCGGDPIAPDNRGHVEMAVERGLNYLDTAPAYGQGRSEAGYAQVLRAIGRDRVFLTTKVSPLGPARNRAYREVFAGLSRGEQEDILAAVAADLRERGATLPDYMGNYFGGQLREIEVDALSDVLERRYRGRIDARATYAETMTRSVDASLRRLNTDHVDILMCPHGASSYAETQVPEIHETFERLREQGKVRALGVSAHNDPAGVLRGAVASGVYSVAMDCLQRREPGVRGAGTGGGEAGRLRHRRNEAGTGGVRARPLDRHAPGAARAAGQDGPWRAEHLPEGLYVRSLEPEPHRGHLQHGGREAGD